MGTTLQSGQVLEGPGLKAAIAPDLVRIEQAMQDDLALLAGDRDD